MASVIHKDALCEMLAASLGQAQAETVVSAAVSERFMAPSHLTQTDCETILDDLGKKSGLVGVVARFAKARLPFMFGGSDTGPHPSIAGTRPRGIGLRASSTSAKRISRPRARRTLSTGIDGVSFERVVITFADGMDHREARRLVTEAATDLGIDAAGRLTRADVDRLLEAIAAKGPRYKTEVTLVRTRLTTMFTDRR